MILVLLPDLIDFLENILLILGFVGDPYINIPGLGCHVKVFIGKLILIEIILFHDSSQLILRNHVAKVTILINFEGVCQAFPKIRLHSQVSLLRRFDIPVSQWL